MITTDDKMPDLQVKTLDGGDSIVSEFVVKNFVSGLRGSALFKGDEDYDEVRKIWNGMIVREPAIIVRCRGVADVIDSVNFARENNIITSVRGGGHNIAGHAVCEGGIIQDSK